VAQLTGPVEATSSLDRLSVSSTFHAKRRRGGRDVTKSDEPIRFMVWKSGLDCHIWISQIAEILGMLRRLWYMNFAQGFDVSFLGSFGNSRNGPCSLIIGLEWKRCATEGIDTMLSAKSTWGYLK
jgi:hypothetical protein